MSPASQDNIAAPTGLRREDNRVSGRAGHGASCAVDREYDQPGEAELETDETASSPGFVRLTVAVERAPEGDDAELDQLTRQLRTELLDTDVEDVRLLREGEAPAGAKVVDPATIGSLAVTLAPAAIPGLIGLLQGWLRGRPAAGVKVTIGRDSIELTNATAQQVERLTKAFLARHPG
jgi:hypothetical protein